VQPDHVNVEVMHASSLVSRSQTTVKAERERGSIRDPQSFFIITTTMDRGDAVVYMFINIVTHMLYEAVMHRWRRNAQLAGRLHRRNIATAARL